MKKVLLFLIMIFFVGCLNKKEIVCNIEGKKAVFVLKDGIISSYKLDNEKISRSIIDEINGTYFTSSKNDEDGIRILNEYVGGLGGSCEEN